MTDTADLVASLVERVQLLEDKAAIHEVLAWKPPSKQNGRRTQKDTAARQAGR